MFDDVLRKITRGYILPTFGVHLVAKQRIAATDCQSKKSWEQLEDDNLALLNNDDEVAHKLRWDWANEQMQLQMTRWSHKVRHNIIVPISIGADFGPTTSFHSACLAFPTIL